MSSFSYAVHDLCMTLSQEEEFVEKECQGRDEGVVRSHETGPETSGESDIYSQLEQKERDLLLAAELGKALLERNEELQRKADLAQEDFNQRVEVYKLTFILLLGNCIFHGNFGIAESQRVVRVYLAGSRANNH